MPLLTIFIYSFTLWFGLYLIARDLHKSGLRYAGLGLVSYAIALAVPVLLPPNLQSTVWYYLPILLPSIFWMGATLYLTPDLPIEPINLHIIVTMLLLILLTFGTAITSPEWVRWVAIGIPFIFLIGVVLRIRQAFTSDLPHPPLVVIFTATLFFALSTALIVLPVAWITQDWVVLAISFDLILLGYAVAVLDAYDEGTALFEDALRSLLSATVAVVVFAGQVVVVIVITDNRSLPMLILLFALITTLLIVLTFYDQIQSLLDAVAFANSPHIKTQRQELRAAFTALPRTAQSHAFGELNEKEFTRMTRRALSHYGDLNKLASSPLIQLPLLDERIDEDNILARANALKALLRENIEQLKPDDEASFSPTDEWRYYNVLYFPYVAGLKPYSRRFFNDELDPAEAEALDWFRTYVPERTLYNWQNSAAELIAQNIRDKLSNY